MSPQDIETVKRICEARQIDKLCHFTNVRNLPTILRNGLVPRSDMFKPEYGIETYTYNDAERLDKHPNATCLSVSFPNYKMFWYLQNKYTSERWCVVLLDIRILWEKGCAFYPKNAAHHELRDLTPISLANAESFESMFSEDHGGIQRSAHIPSSYTTNPQAEVLVFGRIEPSLIKRIAFNNPEKLAEAKAIAQGMKSTIELKTDWSCFTYRPDHQQW